MCITLVEIFSFQICCLNFSDKGKIWGKWNRNGGNNRKKGFLHYYPGIYFDLLCIPRTIFHRCQTVPWDPLNAERMPPPLKKNEKKKKKIVWPYENAWLPWQPVMQFSRTGCTYKINHILAASYHRILNVVPN